MCPRLYVGTYAKYASGSIAGAWIDLESYTDRESFLEACRDLHKDESDPELMFQDFEGFPRSYYSESSAHSNELWAWLELDESDRELLEVYQDNVNADSDVAEARENFEGIYSSESEWAERFLEDTGGLEGIPDHLRNYIDFQAYGRDARIGGDMTFVRHRGDLYAFHNN